MRRDSAWPRRTARLETVRGDLRERRVASDGRASTLRLGTARVARIPVLELDGAVLVQDDLEVQGVASGEEAHVVPADDQPILPSLENRLGIDAGQRADEQVVP